MTPMAESAQPQAMAMDQSTGLLAGTYGHIGRMVMPGSHSTANQTALAARITPPSRGGSAVTASAQSPVNNTTAAYGPWWTCVVTRPNWLRPPQSRTTQAAIASAVNAASGLASASRRRADGSRSARAPSTSSPAAGTRK
jgi:hypothetical protein